MKKGNDLKMTALKMVERVAREQVKVNASGWPPPFCTGIFHQPKRPK